MTARVSNRGMSAPSPQRTSLSRRAALRTALGAVLAALVLVPAAGAAPGDRGVFVTKGAGRVIFAGGGGIAYGTVFSGGTLNVVDYSAAHDLKVDSPVVPTLNPDQSRTYSPAGGAKSLAFRLSGSAYRVTVQGSSTYNAVGVYGRLLQVRGKGTITVNGGRRKAWNIPIVKLGKIPKAVREAVEAAAIPAPLPAAPEPPLPPVTTAPAVTTSATT
jgi:hypothetical protein